MSLGERVPTGIDGLDILIKGGLPLEGDGKCYVNFRRVPLLE
jgi:hypothetical protein